MLLDLDMLLFWTTSGIVFAQLLYLVVIISWAIPLWRVILRASDWQIATWKGGNNRLTRKFILQTVHYMCSDVQWGEYFGTMMSPSWELQCEMNFNLKCLQREEGGAAAALSYLESQKKIILHHYRGKSQIQLAFHFHFTKQTYLIFLRRCNCCVKIGVTDNQTDQILRCKVNAIGLFIADFDMSEQENHFCN